MKPCFTFIPGLAVVLCVVAWLGAPAARAEAAAPPATNAITNANATNTAPVDEEADKAWRETRKLIQEPMPPEEWQQKQPTQEEVVKFYTDALLKGADAAKDFYTRFPNHPKAGEARKSEYRFLMINAMQFKNTNQNARLEALEKKRLADPDITPDERFLMRWAGLQRLLRELPGSMPELEKGARALQKDFPEREESYRLLMMVLMQSQGDQAQALAKVIIESPAPDQFKAMAQGILKKAEAVGKPINIKYTAVDGREVDMAKLKGKVVLVDFWASWCVPCMMELPNVKSVYNNLHDKGFEIVGINLDEDKAALEKTVKQKEMTWPQYFDGARWQNKYAQEFGVNSIPALWLVDKKGILRDTDVQGEFQDKVAKLLAE